MQSFRTEFENPLVEKDIIDLERKIKQFREGTIDEEKFRSLRLARGVYGQRQQGVQMVRIKLPYGKMSVAQLRRIADVSDEYATGNLHLTTRQDVQIHFVSLDRTPQLWAELEKDNITLREACGNTVRNITASPLAGIDADEPFDVSDDAQAMFEYFLRNPICQEMGRKIKIAFSSSEKDTAMVYMHDIGFIPKLQTINGEIKKGFKVLVGGGLGAQPFLGKIAYEFLEDDQIIPYTEALLRVFDRHGERNSRHKARLKFLIHKLGYESFSQLVEAEKAAIKVKSFPISRKLLQVIPAITSKTSLKVNAPAYQVWLKSNVFEQKQPGFFGVYLKVSTGDIKTPIARKLADAVEKYADGDDMRITINQGLLLKYVAAANLGPLYHALNEIGLAQPGFDSPADITTCPGTDTCNLGIASSTGITKVLEAIIQEEYPDLIYDNNLKIKISGCMNGCGQHSIANIGFHGSSIKSGKHVLPAMQVLLGGGTLGDGTGRIADKLLKVPSKRVPNVLRSLLDDFEKNANEGEYFNGYYDRKSENYFYTLLKPFADLSNVLDEEFVDWGHEVKYTTEIGVGECAGVMVDLVATLLFEVEEKLGWATDAFKSGAWSDAIYHTYSVFVSGAKALLLDKQVQCNTQMGILNDFDKHFAGTTPFNFIPSFSAFVLRINQHEPNESFADTYLKDATNFYNDLVTFRKNNNNEG